MFNKAKQRYDKKLETDFLSEALEIVEKPASPIGHFAIWTTIIILVVFMAWSIIGKMDEIAVASAEITPVNGLNVVQTVREGIITDILVREGDFVEAGQELIVLDTAAEMISMENVSDKINLLNFQNTLLNLILSGEDISSYADENNISSFDEIQVIEMVSSIQEDYLAGRVQYVSQISQYSKQVEIEESLLEKLKIDLNLLINKKSELINLYAGDSPENNVLDIYISKLEVARRELEEYQQLLESGAIAKYQVEEKQNEIDDIIKQIELQDLRVEYETASNSAELNEIQRQIDLQRQDITTQEGVVERQTESHLQSQQALDKLEIEYKQNITNMIVYNNTALSDLDSEYLIRQEMQNSLVLTAPVDGYIQSIAVNTVGGVVTPAQPIMLIVPDDAELIAEVEVLNKDIGFVFVGQDVSVKLDAFSFNKYGKLTGTVTYISPSATHSDYKGLVYKVKIAIDRDYFNVNGENISISSGMSGVAEIKFGERRIIEFLLQPVFEYFDNSLKVR